MTNFKTDTFSGSLIELLEDCNSHLESSNVKTVFYHAHDWVIEQPLIKDNILPIRKHSQFPDRGYEQKSDSGKFKFLSADNEPLCFLYKNWFSSKTMQMSISDLLVSKSMPASWSCDLIPANKYKYSGISTAFRDRGLKLAHMNDAGKYNKVGTTDEIIKTRFFRSQSPFNVFLFPSFKLVSFDSSNFSSTHDDFAEDKTIRLYAMLWLYKKLNLDFSKLGLLFDSDFKIPSDWENHASRIIINVTPRAKNHKGSAIANVVNMGTAVAGAFPKSTQVYTFDQAVDLYKRWRAVNPNVERLDGRLDKKGNRTKFLIFSVDGFTSPRHDFHSKKRNVSFKGDEYNGVVYFPGDAKCKKIDEFIDLYESCDDYRDVLIPYATNETKNGSDVSSNRMFWLKGYNDIEGFYLYHI